MDFEETNEEFYIFGVLHARFAGKLVGALGVVIFPALTAVGLLYFQWQLYDFAVDVAAFMAFIIFCVSGCAIHLLVIYGVHKTRARYLSLFSLYHLFLIFLNTVTVLISIGEILSDMAPAASPQHSKIFLLGQPLCNLLQVLMIYIVARCKSYLRKRARWLRLGRAPPVRRVLQSGAVFTTKNSVSPMSSLPSTSSERNIDIEHLGSKD